MLILVWVRLLSQDLLSTEIHNECIDLMLLNSTHCNFCDDTFLIKSSLNLHMDLFQAVLNLKRHCEKGFNICGKQFKTSYQ